MIAKRIIPCLDVKNGQVVKGIQFKEHRNVGDILSLAAYYDEQGADELVFYDITASCEQRTVDYEWIKRVAQTISIPFCVAGGIRSLAAAEQILQCGADKISVNSPALENPKLITDLVKNFGSQCITIGVDSYEINDEYYVYQYTGNPEKTIKTSYLTKDWLVEVCDRGAGEIVLNCMNKDGMRTGYDLKQLTYFRKRLQIPLVASGGAGSENHFVDVFSKSDVSGALAASVFHSKKIGIPNLKRFLDENLIEVRCV